eukprot:4503255-Prymnesium_polylepis.1
MGSASRTPTLIIVSRRASARSFWSCKSTGLFSSSCVLSCVSSSAIVVVVVQWLVHGRCNTLETTSDSRL